MVPCVDWNWVSANLAVSSGVNHSCCDSEEWGDASCFSVL